MTLSNVVCPVDYKNANGLKDVYGPATAALANRYDLELGAITLFG
jgi:hypothetical protein